jgi:hypothetical protein
MLCQKCGATVLTAAQEKTPVTVTVTRPEGKTSYSLHCCERCTEKILSETGVTERKDP